MKFLNFSEKKLFWLKFLGVLVLIVLFSQLKIGRVNAGPSNTGTDCVPKEGVNTFSVDGACGSGKYRYMTFVCYDGYSKKEGSLTSCKTSGTWRSYAEDYCKGHGRKCPTMTATPTPYATSTNVIPGSFLSLISSKTTYSIGDSFGVMVEVNSVGNKVDGVDGVITYNQSLLTLVSAKKSPAVVFKNSGDDCVINQNFGSGKLAFTCYSGDSLSSVAVNGDLVWLTFMVKNYGESKIAFECVKGSSEDSNIVSVNSIDIIDCAKNINLTVSARQSGSPSESGVNGKCGDKRNTCIAGKVNDDILPDTKDDYRWKCMGVNGGKNVNCALAKKIDGKCGSKKNTCSSGTVSNISSSSSQYKWKCVGRYGGKTVNCSVKK